MNADKNCCKCYIYTLFLDCFCALFVIFCENHSYYATNKNLIANMFPHLIG